MNTLAPNVDLELLKLKALRKRIKHVHASQISDLVNSYKKDIKPDSDAKKVIRRITPMSS